MNISEDLTRVPGLGEKIVEVANNFSRLPHRFGHLGPRGPRGGPPALVIPGFLTTDRTTLALRRGFADGGWRVHGWGRGRNNGAYAGVIEDLDERLDEVRHGDKALVVGWSLGGVMARELARTHPDKVRAVVTLASPFSGDRRHNNVWQYYEKVAGHAVDDPPVAQKPDKPPVPTLALYAEKDGLLAQGCQRGETHESDACIGIPCGHFRIGMSRPMIARVVDAVNAFVPK
ncbi:esterase/lipase family protein [Sphingomicrobium aestuariivivum]|uniref:esterase/lipase family protein n=1 Tax=Sphingomicrobium aestuariivivum TaxID=1582356 RepID=UPI001FD637AF|nr:alpha/beta fold hydrolase [Sphingomicrobium aestuariivivum]MCJ8191311.1 alpha/beta fold hydrolase [Sphingomicrobium aestuariivivum]